MFAPKALFNCFVLWSDNYSFYQTFSKGFYPSIYYVNCLPISEGREGGLEPIPADIG